MPFACPASPRPRGALLALTVAIELATGAVAGAPCDLAERPAQAWRHALTWTLSSDEVLFGLVTAVIRLADGTLAVADAQLGHVLLITPEGEVTAVLEVKGEGPGRLASLTGLGETAAGELILVQAWPGRVEVIARDGTPRRSLRPRAGDGDGVTSVLRVIPGAGRWLGLLAEVRHVPPRRVHTVLQLAWLRPEDLGVKGVILRRESTAELRQGFVDETAIDLPRRAWDLLPGGRAIVAPERGAYALEVHDPHDGQVLRLERPHLPLARPEAEKDLLRRRFALTVNGRPQSVSFRFFETAEAVQTVVALDDGRVLLGGARCFHALPPGVSARLDLVDLAAATVAEVRLSFPLRPWVDALLVLPDRDVVVVRHGFGGLAAAGPAFTTGGDAAGVPALEYWSHLGESP